MKPEYMEAFTEVYEIFKIMPEELLNKIPIKFYKMIEEEREKEYYPNIKEPLEEQKLKNETIIILGLIYRDFLCTPEERKILQEKDAKQLKEAQQLLEEQIRQKYDPNDIFKNKNKIVEEQKQNIEETKMVVVKEKWYISIFNIVKSLFKKN